MVIWLATIANLGLTRGAKRRSLRLFDGPDETIIPIDDFEQRKY